jgi:hypothetical protein
MTDLYFEGGLKSYDLDDFPYYRFIIIASIALVEIATTFYDIATPTGAHFSSEMGHI